MKDLGMLVLAVYLILTGIKAVFDLTVPFDTMVLGVVAVAAGVLLILKK